MPMEIMFPGGKRVDALHKSFTIKTDQDPKRGGEGSAPEPFDLFMASIGTCAGIFVLVFCQQRNIPTENIKLVMDWSRNSETKLIDKFRIDIQLPPDFPEKYKNAVVKAAELCSVAKHLENPPEIEVTSSVRN